MIYRLCVLSLLLFSCGQQTELSDRFMNECDCIVYQNEIIKQRRTGYTIAHIDPSKASGCVKNQLSHTSIIDFEDSLGVESVVVVSKTPEKYIRSVKGWALIYGTKNTRLSHVNEQKQRIQFVFLWCGLRNRSHETFFNQGI